MSECMLNSSYNDIEQGYFFFEDVPKKYALQYTVFKLEPSLKL